jgi:hypothetical protein
VGYLADFFDVFSEVFSGVLSFFEAAVDATTESLQLRFYRSFFF